MDVNWLNANYLPWLILFFPLLSGLVIFLATSRNVVASHDLIEVVRSTNHEFVVSSAID